MPPQRAPRGGYQRPKNAGKTLRRLLGYLTRSPLPVIFVLLCLVTSVATNAVYQEIYQSQQEGVSE